MTIVNLRAEAIAEAGRLTRARQAVRDADLRALQRLETGATRIALAKSSRVKRTLGSRACFVWQAMFLDASGRIVESTLVPMLVKLPASLHSCRGRDRRAAIRIWVKAAETPIRDRVAAEREAWRADTVVATEAFFGARLAREGAIVQPSAPPNVSAQAGLFDRRDEQARHIRALAAEQVDDALTERRQGVAAARAIEALPPRLLLVLVP